MGNFHLHIDRPGGILLQNLNQDFVGWLALESSQSLKDLRFEFNRQPFDVEYFQRDDAQAAMPFSQVFGWVCRFERDRLRTLPGKSVEFTVTSAGEVVYRKVFLRTRSLLSQQNDSPLFFMHIPKTAGTALRQLVDYVFTDLPNLFIYGQYPGLDTDQVAKLKPAHLESRELVYGHYGYDFVSDFGASNPKVITVFRDPSELVESYRRFGSVAGDRYYDNPLTRHLSGERGTLEYGQVTRGNLDAALKNLERNVFVLRSENLQQFADLLTQSFDVPRFVVPRINVSREAEGVEPSETPALLQYDRELDAAASANTETFFEFLDR